MARIRYIKPDFFEDTRLADISLPARMLYIGLWCWMDRQGLTEDNPKLIKRNVFPYDDEITSSKVKGLIDELCKAGRLLRFQHGNLFLLFCPKFETHQKFHPGEKSKYGVSQEELLATVEQLVSNLQEGVLQPANNALTGTLTGTGTGTGTGTNTFSAEVETTSAEFVVTELQDPLTDFLLGKVKLPLQESWLKTYQDPVWIKAQLKQAVNWMQANPKKAPKSNFSRFLNGWLARGWERHRRTLPSNHISNPDRYSFFEKEKAL